MTSETLSPRRGFWASVIENGEDWVNYLILAGIAVAALAGAFTHMHDWTIFSINSARLTRGLPADTADWLGWANAVISELLPISSFITIRKRQRQKRNTMVPTMIFLGSAALSLTAQLSATGMTIPMAPQFLAALPALAWLLLGHSILNDAKYTRELRERMAERAARKARTLARRQEYAVRRAAELEAQREREAAELAAKLELDRIEREAELRRQDAERAAELERERRNFEAEHALELRRIEQAEVTERIKAQAAQDAADRRAAARRENKEAAAEQAARIEAARIAAEAQAAKVKAEAAALAADAEAKRQAMAALRAERSRPAPAAAAVIEQAGRKRRDRAETAMMVDAVLDQLPAGTDRAAAVKAVVRQLSVTPEYARQFVPAGFIKGGSSAASSAGSSATAPASSVGSSAASSAVEPAASSAEDSLSDSNGRHGKRHLAAVGSS